MVMARTTTLRRLLLNFLASSAIPLAMASFPSTSPNSAVSAAGSLLPRADPTCGGVPGMVQCPNFPPNFCCETASSCVGFNNNKSVICCPSGQNCDGIAPTNCDIQFYNATAHPESPMHLADLDAAPKPCGDQCCPAGYTCNAKQFCVLNALASATAAATSTATAGPTLTASAKPTGTAAAGSGAAPASNCPTFPIAAVLVGLGAGLVGGALFTLIFIWCIGRCAQRRQASHPSDQDSLGPVAAKVSDPIYIDQGGATRTDFLRHASRSRWSPRSPGTFSSSRRSPTIAGSVGSPPKSPVERVRSLFSRTPTTTSRPRWASSDYDRNRDLKDPQRSDADDVRTPPRQIRREPSTESIKIYSPPDARQTTFGDMLKAAGGHSEPPVPSISPLHFERGPGMTVSPGMSDPRSR